jgi:hypothetical protein
MTVILPSGPPQENLVDVGVGIRRRVAEEVPREEPFADLCPVVHTDAHDVPIGFSTREVGEAQVEVEHVAPDALAGQRGLEEAHTERRQVQ